MITNFLKISFLTLLAGAFTTCITWATQQTVAEIKCPPVEPCLVTCVNSYAACHESEKVLNILEKLTKAYVIGDLTTYEQYLDDHCVFYEEANKEFISGKKDCLAHLQESFSKHAPGGSEPLKSFTIDQPYAKVIGNNCVVTFVAYKSIGGIHPRKEKANVTDVFVKSSDTWKKLYWHGKWEPVTE